MKKVILLFIALFALVLTSCNVGGGNVTPQTKTYTVSFDSNGGTIVENQIIEEGLVASKPANPIKEGYTFICWLHNDKVYVFDTPVNNNLVLVAKWEEEGTHEHNYLEDVVEPTCTDMGFTIYTCECGYTYRDNYISNLQHDLVMHEKVEPTCTEIGCEAYVECTRCSYTTYKELEALDHDLVSHEGKTPTDIEIGWKEYVTCTRCDYTTYEELPVVEVERAELEVYEENGYRYINYGSYPQTHVNDEELLVSLNTLAETNDRGYYEFEGNEYVKIIANIKSDILDSGTNSTKFDKYGNPSQYSSGATIIDNRCEWFKVEPIKWRILSEKNGEIQILSEYILTAQCYYKDTYYRSIDGVDIAPNNYKYSDIREFLNESFLNAAFTKDQQQTLITTEVYNNEDSTLDQGQSNKYVCENTFDKIYLLSYQDICNVDYGLGSSEERATKATDYAKATGVMWTYSDDNIDYSSWWLRSPDSMYYYETFIVLNDYTIISTYITYFYGVRVAATIAVN